METEPDNRRLVQNGDESRTSIPISSTSISHPLLGISSNDKSNSNGRASNRTEASTKSTNTSAVASSTLVSRVLNNSSMEDTSDLGPRSIQEQQIGRSANASPLISPAKQSLEGDRNRYSFSSLLSISSFNPTSPSIEGKSSSVAGSLRSNTEPSSTRLDSKLLPLLSMESAMTATTATDITSVTSSTHSHPQGKIFIFYDNEVELTEYAQLFIE